MQPHGYKYPLCDTVSPLKDSEAFFSASPHRNTCQRYTPFVYFESSTTVLWTYSLPPSRIPAHLDMPARWSNTKNFSAPYPRDLQTNPATDLGWGISISLVKNNKNLIAELGEHRREMRNQKLVIAGQGWVRSLVYQRWWNRSPRELRQRISLDQRSQSPNRNESTDRVWHSTRHHPRWWCQCGLTSLVPLPTVSSSQWAECCHNCRSVSTKPCEKKSKRLTTKTIPNC